MSQMVTWESAGEPVQPAYCSSPNDLTMIGSAGVPCQSLASDSHFCISTMVCSENRKPVCAGGCHLTGAAGIQRPHVEDVNPLHLAQDLDTLETSGLLEIGGDGAGLGTLGEEVILILDLCMDKLAFIPISQKRCCRKSWVPRVMDGNIPENGFALAATLYLLLSSIQTN